MPFSGLPPPQLAQEEDAARDPLTQRVSPTCDLGLKGAHLCIIAKKAPGPPPNFYSPSCSAFSEAVWGDGWMESAGWQAPTSGPGWTGVEWKRGHQQLSLIHI